MGIWLRSTFSLCFFFTVATALTFIVAVHLVSHSPALASLTEKPRWLPKKRNGHSIFFFKGNQSSKHSCFYGRWECVCFALFPTANQSHTSGFKAMFERTTWWRKRERALHKNLEKINHLTLEQDWKGESWKEKWRGRKVRVRINISLWSGF